MRISVLCAAVAASVQHGAALRWGGKTDPHAAAHSNFNPLKRDRCADMKTPPMCADQRDQGFSAGLVVSTFKEDIRWLNVMPWDGNITVYVHDRSRERSHESHSAFSDDVYAAEYAEAEVMEHNEKRKTPVVFETIPNKGDEASAYLQYIITKYYKLPDVVFFIQGHRCATHAEFDMAKALPSMRACFPYEKGYLDLNTYDGRRSSTGWHCRESTDLVKHPIMGYKIKDLKGIWSNLFEEEYGQMPDIMCWDGYAQFGVRRELIQRHPVSFYKKLFKGVVNGTTTMEFFWKLTFLPEAVKMHDHSEERFQELRKYVLSHSR